MQIYFYGQVLGFEPARKEGETKGYLKLFDRETRRNFELGCKFMVDEESLPVTPEKWMITGVSIFSGQKGVFMTCENLQVLPPERTRKPQTENGA